MSDVKSKSPYAAVATSNVELTEKDVEKGNTTSSSTQDDTMKKDDGNELKDVKGMTFLELMKVLKPFFWPDEGSESATVNRVRTTATWLSVFASKSCSLLAPFFLLDATDQLIAGDYNAAWKNIAYFSTLLLGRSFFKEIQGALYAKVKQQALIQLQRYTFSHLHKLSLGWHLTKKTGAVMKSMDRGIDATSTLVTYMFLYLIPAIGECIAVMILFFSKYSEVYLVGISIAVSVTLYIFATVKITIWRKKFREKMNKNDNEYHDKATDSITNFETVKYFAAEEYEVNRYTSSVIKYQGYQASTLISMQFLNFMQAFILQGCMVACLLISGKAVSTGEMTMGTWVAIQSWINQIFQPLNFLGTIYSGVVQALIDVRNLSDLLSEKPDIIDDEGTQNIPYFAYRTQGKLMPTDDANEESIVERGRERSKSNSKWGSGKSARSESIGSEEGEVTKKGESIDMSSGIGLEFNNVVFHYPSQPPEKGLKGVNFVVPPGSTTAIVGSTGAGKTTVSRLLFRFYEPLQGCVKLGDYDISKYTQHSVRYMIGIVPQDTVMFNESILYNIRYGRLDATDEEVYAAAEAAQIRTFIESLPESWKTVVGERGLKLSGGEKQRVAIARCLLKNPPVVVLDEATSALDTITENSVQEALDTLGQNRTVVIIAHRLSTIRHADQILAMENGEVVESGTHDELLQIENGVYKNLWQMQDRHHEPITPVLEVEAEPIITAGVVEI